MDDKEETDDNEFASDEENWEEINPICPSKYYIHKIYSFLKTLFFFLFFPSI